MSQFKWCYDKSCKGKCEDYDNNNCDGCYFFEAYILGMMEMAESAKWTDITKVNSCTAEKLYSGKCSKCNNTVKVCLNSEDTKEFAKALPFCPKCAASMLEKK